jgi:glycosyltransferase involved in cell wall biosynthesis
MNEGKIDELHRPVRIGLGTRNYSYRRVSYGLPLGNVEYRKPPYLPWRYLKKGDLRLANVYRFLPFPGVDLYHLWTGVCLNSHAWISSFEAHYPRYCGIAKDTLYSKLIDRINSKHCKRLLPFSDFSRHFFLGENRGLIDQSVVDKTEVFYGGVEVRATQEEIERKHEKRDRNAAIRVGMVGHDFFRKGGSPALDAMIKIREAGANIELLLISSLSTGDYVTGATTRDRSDAIARIENSPFIEWHQSLSHEAVMKKLATCDVGLLLTLDDTFGWSATEMMSVGVPIIGTNVCAMPEILGNGQHGFQIDLPLLENRRWQGMCHPQGSSERQEELCSTYRYIGDEVRKYFETIVAQPELILEMSNAGIEHLKQNHDPRCQAAKLRQIYTECRD